MSEDQARIDIRSSDRASAQNGVLLRLGIVGSVIAAICCFTPALVFLLPALGLSAALGWLDYVLLPTLAGFLALTGFALWRRLKTGSNRLRS